MGHRLRRLALAAGMVFGGWKGVQSLPIPTVKEVFNDSSARITETEGRTAPVPQYHMPAARLPDPAAIPSGEIWRVRMGSWEMAKRGHHPFLEFAPYCEKSAACPSK